MPSSHSNTHTEAAKMEQIVTEFFSKSLHIILESRSPIMSSRSYRNEQVMFSPVSSSSSSSLGVKPRDKWFNLALRECPGAHENIDMWHQSNLDPMVVDIVLLKKPVQTTYSPRNDVTIRVPSSRRREIPFDWSSDQELQWRCETKSEKIIERWILQHDCSKPRDCGSVSRRTSNSLHILYKKSIVLLRSLYATLRLLPAYKLFRALNSTENIHKYTLSHRVSSLLKPLAAKEDEEMQRFEFTPVDTSTGRLCILVLYLPLLSDISLDSESSTPISPQFIQDYVGSPLADPMKRFPSLPVSHNLPSSLSFSRRHSWSNGCYRSSSPSTACSPSPTHGDPRVSVSHPCSRHFSSVDLQILSNERRFPSPNYTPSSSPSPPVRTGSPSALRPKRFLRSESTPVNVPSRQPLLSIKQNLPPSPPLKHNTHLNSKNDATAQVSPEEGVVHKIFGQKVFSRSSSRSRRGDFYDFEFPCPFDVDDDDMEALCNMSRSSVDKNSDPLDRGQFPLRKSHDAAVGALVQMLQKAPPLSHRENSVPVALTSKSITKSQSSSFELPPDQLPSGLSSSLAASKTTADALEELQGYKQLVKGLLLGHGCRPQF